MLTKQIKPRLIWLYPIRASVLLGAIIFFMFIIFRPFQTNLMSSFDLLVTSLIVAFITGVSYFTIFLIFKKKIFAEWTYWKDILLAHFILLMMVLLNFLVFSLLDRHNIIGLRTQELTLNETLLYTLKIGWFIYVLIILFEDVLKEVKISEEIDLKRDNKDEILEVPNEDEKTVRLYGLNNNEFLDLKPTSILFIKSEGNYVEVRYLNDNNILSEIIRNSLKKMCNQLRDYEFIYCPHRSYLINTKHITNVKGNSKSKQIIIERNNQYFEIPISRLKLPEFNEIINYK